MVCGVIGGVGLCSGAGERPNILFFLVDDMGIQDSSLSYLQDASGQAVVSELNRLYRTPEMEKLAGKARLFTQARAYSVCSPTRVSLMTGLDAPRHGVTQWTHPKTQHSEPGRIQTKTLKSPEWEVRGVPEGVPLLPRLLKKAGYATLFAGKAHFGPDDTPNGDPRHLGFDVNIAGFGGGGPGSYYGKYNYSAAHRKGKAQWDVPGLEAYHGTGTYLTEAITLEMKKAITDAVRADKPFFAYMSHYAVHAPFAYPDPRFEANYPDLKGAKLAFATMVEGVDRSLGDLCALLDELGVAEDTLIVFYSDNGSASPLGSRPLRGNKGTRFEGGSRVPLMMAWAKPDPDNRFQKRVPILAGSREHAMVNCSDMMPSLLQVAGVRHPEPERLDGYDITPYLSGKDAGRPQEFLIHFPHAHSNSLFSSYIKQGWKVIYQYATEEWELYDLAKDPYENRNLAMSSPERLQALGSAMIRELDQRGARYPVALEGGAAVKPRLPGVAVGPEGAASDVASEQALRQAADTQSELKDDYSPQLKPYHPDHQFVSKDWYNWGGSVTKGDDGLYYLFYSRWPKSYSFKSWLSHSEVAVATSPNPSGPWTYRFTALKGRGGKHWDAVTAHNPKITRFNGKYYLYYISTHCESGPEVLLEAAKIGPKHSIWPELRSKQRIGVAEASRLEGPWKRMDTPLVEPAGPIHTITVNPAVTRMADGRYLMILKGDKSDRRGSLLVQGVAIGESATGPFEVQSKLAFAQMRTEDASVWYDAKRCRYYAIFHAHGFFGMITSTDGLHWERANQFKFAKKAYVSEGGSVFKGKRMERPSVYIGESGQPEVFVSSYLKGNETGIFTIPMKP